MTNKRPTIDEILQRFFVDRLDGNRCGAAPLVERNTGLQACLQARYDTEMAQVTWRAPDELVRRMQHLAAGERVSMNELMTRILALATDSDERDPEAVRLRDRLRSAGMLAEGNAPAGPPDADALARAREAAGKGTPLSALVSASRT